MEQWKIALSCETIGELKKYGKIGSSYDDVVKDLLTHASVCDRYWKTKIETGNLPVSV